MCLLESINRTYTLFKVLLTSLAISKIKKKKSSIFYKKEYNKSEKITILKIRYRRNEKSPIKYKFV